MKFSNILFIISVQSQDILEGAGKFNSTKFWNSDEKSEQDIFSSKRWQFVYQNQTYGDHTQIIEAKQITDSKPTKTKTQQSVYRQPPPYQSIQITKDPVDGTPYLEMIKGIPSVSCTNHKCHKVSYNDGLFYDLETYGLMLKQQRQTLIQELTKAKKDKNDKMSIEQIEGSIKAVNQDYKKPKHVRFKVNTQLMKNLAQESCNVRLTSYSTKVENPEENSILIEIEPRSDVFFFRFGYYNYQKINMNNMLNHYIGDRWYQIDIVIDWADKKLIRGEEQRVYTFIDGKPIAQEKFFSVEPYGSMVSSKKDGIQSSNALIIYGLSPGSISKFKDLEVCITKCDGAPELIYTSALNLKIAFLTIISLIYAV